LIISADKKRLQFTISANRFLRGMIRLLVGNLLKIGLGELSLEDFKAYLELEKSPINTLPAFANGLYLSKIEYPYVDFENKSKLVELLQISS
jgi:tRNA pseudouridine38-40 synthase